jgi:hypothetical protein
MDMSNKELWEYDLAARFAQPLHAVQAEIDAIAAISADKFRALDICKAHLHAAIDKMKLKNTLL